MRYLIRYVYLSFICVCSVIKVQAQMGISSSGGESKGNGGSASFSVGQVFYAAQYANDAYLIQGVQQPYEISVVTSLPSSINLRLMVDVFPNPTSDYLILRLGDQSLMGYGHLYYALYDLYGKLLAEQNLDASEARIDMRHWAPAPYFLKVMQAGNNAVIDLKTFKIIKH
jgi:hypothetical protein